MSANSEQNRPSGDVVDRALQLLERDVQHELPDRELEARLVARARQRSGGASRGGIRSGIAGGIVGAVLKAAALLSSLVLMGFTLEATGALDGVKAWWYSIRVGDQQIDGAMDGSGEVHRDFLTPDGYRVQVRLAREPLADGAGTRTTFESRESGHGLLIEEEQEVIESTASDDSSSSAASGDRVAGDPVAGDPASIEALPASALVGTRLIYSWTDEDLGYRALHIGRAPRGPGSRLLVHSPASVSTDAQDSRPVHVLAVTGQVIGPGWRVTVFRTESGMLAVSLADGAGVEELIVVGRGPAVTEFESASGRVRASLGDLPPSAAERR